jgi:hypothetical protein
MINISFWFMLVLIYWVESVHGVEENAEASVVASKEIGLEVNDDKTIPGHVSRSECRTKSQYKD